MLSPETQARLDSMSQENRDKVAQLMEVVRNAGPLGRLNLASFSFRSRPGDLEELWSMCGIYLSSLHEIASEQQKQIDRLTEAVLKLEHPGA